MTADTEVDAALIEAVRAGDPLAYGLLFRRHQPAARRVASMMWRDRAEVDDLVAESFLRVLVAIREGAGPAERFRPYLLVTLRNLAMDWARRRDRYDPWAAREDGVPGVEEIVVDRLTGEVALAALGTLPPRWRHVLWHTEMLGTRPAQLAEELGMTPNGVAALAVRAREGLRQAFLQAHVPEAGEEECRHVRRRLGAWTRGKVTARQRRTVAVHVDGCPACRRVAAVLDNVNGGLPALALLPLLGRFLNGSGATAMSKAVAAVTLAAVTTTVAGPVPLPELAAPPAQAAPAPVAPGTPDWTVRGADGRTTLAPAGAPPGATMGDPGEVKGEEFEPGKEGQEPKVKPDNAAPSAKGKPAQPPKAKPDKAAQPTKGKPAQPPGAKPDKAAQPPKGKPAQPPNPPGKPEAKPSKKPQGPEGPSLRTPDQHPGQGAPADPGSGPGRES